MKVTRLLILSLLIFFSCKEAVKNTAPQFDYPFQNPSLSIDERVDDLVGRLTVNEKVLQLFNAAPAIPRLGIPAYNWWNESLHGVARAGKATVYPQAIGLASTFDEDLMYRVATTISDEARAKHHNFQREGVSSIYTGLTFWSPNINIFRDPRWGRGQETYGEDPYLTGRMAVNFIKGLQGDDPKYFKTIATAKHYAVHNGPEATRHTDNFFVNDRDLYETYLPAFKAAVEEGNVQSIMCAYNRFRDQPCCGSDLLLQKILRDEFGFEGYVVTDCGAVTDFYKKGHHELVETPSQAMGWALSSGSDLNCEMDTAFVSDNIEEAIERGVVNEADINVALKRLFKARFQLGMFDPAEMVPYANIPFDKVGNEEHLALAQQVAEQSLVLLKNDGVLPLKKGRKVALIGPNANNLDVLLGNYNGCPINPVTPLDALKEYLGEDLEYAPGSPLVQGFFGEMTTIPEEVLFHREGGRLLPGLQAEYYKDLSKPGDSDISRVDANVDFIWTKTPISDLLEETFAVDWTGVLKPIQSGAYQFRMNTLYGVSKIYVNGDEVLDKYISLEAGKEYDLKVEYQIEPFWWGNTVTPDAELVWVNTSEDLEGQAIAAAQASDVILFCGGISPRLEGEEMKLKTDGFAHGDRTHIKLPAIQEDLHKKLHAVGKPIVYINFSGSAIALNWQKENLAAIVQAFYPGEAAGTAITNLIFGEYSPSGRLPVTFYKSVDDLPDFSDYRMKGRTYKYFNGEVLYPFGHGLSYTTFEYSDLKLPQQVRAGKSAKISVNITNVGDMDGREIAQLYITDVEASTPVPLRSLAGTKSVFIKKGGSETITFEVSPEQLSLINKDYERVVEPGTFSVAIGGCVSTKNIKESKQIARGEFPVTGEIIKL